MITLSWGPGQQGASLPTGTPVTCPLPQPVEYSFAGWIRLVWRNARPERLSYPARLECNRTAERSIKKSNRAWFLVKIPAFDFQCIDVKVGDENIPRLDRRRSIPRIPAARRTASKLVAAASRQFELSITIRQGG